MEGRASVFHPLPEEYIPGVQGRTFLGGYPTTVEPVPGAATPPIRQRGPINNWTEAAGTGAVLAVDALTGEERWRFEMTDIIRSGILTTGSDLLFTGARSGYFQALHARTGKLLWKVNLGGQIVNGPMTYEAEVQQYVAIIAGHSLSVFALRN